MPRKSSTSQADYDEADNGAHDPLIEALLHHLPAPGDPFPDKDLWMQILGLALQLIYPEAGIEGVPDAPRT